VVRTVRRTIRWSLALLRRIRKGAGTTGGRRCVAYLDRLLRGIAL
jgi:hypothetical protein